MGKVRRPRCRLQWRPEWGYWMYVVTGGRKWTVLVRGHKSGADEVYVDYVDPL